MHVLNSLLENVPSNLGDASDEQGGGDRYQNYRRIVPRPLRFPHDGRLLLVFEKRPAINKNIS